MIVERNPRDLGYYYDKTPINPRNFICEINKRGIILLGNILVAECILGIKTVITIECRIK